MIPHTARSFFLPTAAAICALLALSPLGLADGSSALDRELETLLAQHGFTGTVQATLEQRLGRHLDHQLADLGHLLFFDTAAGLNNDNNCSGCHSPTRGFGDTQSIAIGVDNNGVVGPRRAGPRNQRRTPMAANTAFFPNLMWNSRFASLADDPFRQQCRLSLSGSRSTCWASPSRNSNSAWSSRTRPQTASPAGKSMP